MVRDNTKLVIRLEFVGSLTNTENTVSKAIKNLIVMCDEDFIPPLSYRGDTVEILAEMVMNEKKDYEPYFKKVSAQNNIIAYCGDKVVAFMSFKHDVPHDHLSSVAKDGDVVNYVTTICVDKSFRRHGIAGCFYDFIENKKGDLPKEMCGDCVATRTWHTNESHITLLDKRGYCLAQKLIGDRINNKTGEKIDTVYYCKRLVFVK
jgi:ribosomal protein S18 acetylase RimI-like enzyme